MKSAKASTAARGYGGPHQQERKRNEAVVARGEAFCAAPRCSHPRGRWIAPGEPWDQGHHPFDKTVYLGPMHQKCNRNTTLERAFHRPCVRRADGWL